MNIFEHTLKPRASFEGTVFWVLVAFSGFMIVGLTLPAYVSYGPLRRSLGHFTGLHR